ncbi:MAG: ATP-binding protein [Clostridiales bacterium]|jgi:anti-sigma regulatory factor (Ser/Thr protein kinase)|nr:ATP-binding protein [Clostridiales bacterium]
MSEENELSQIFEILGGDFGHAGSVSTKVKEILKEVGIDPSIIRRAAIVAYEAEMNVVMYARKALFALTLTPGQIHFKIEDEGPGIPDIELAMQEGFSTATEEMREMGFGAGMGLPNIRKNADRFLISSLVGRGTMLSVYFFLNQESRG